MMQQPYLSIIGLAYRARKCATGTETIIEQIRMKKAKLILIAKDASDRTKKQLYDKCNTYHIPYIEVGDRKTLGSAIGKSDRVAIAILDKGFANKLQTLLL